MIHTIRNDEGDGSYSVEVSPRISKYLHYSTLENGTNAILLEEIERNTEFAEFKFQSGDVLIAINNLPIVSLTRLELEKKIKTLRKRNPASLVKLRFYSPGHQETSTEEYIEFIKSKEYYSLHGFRCSLDEMLKEKRTFQKLFKHREKHSIAWFNYLKSIGGYRNLMPGGLFNHHNNDLRQLIRNGIPTGLRSQIWPQISLSTIYRLSYPKDYYYQLVNSIDERLNIKVVEDIAKDLGRTFPNHPDFDEGSVKRGELQRVLSAYGIHNARLGYCQGMNFITATMLLVLSEEESFWLLATIVEKILPPEVYGAMMIDASTDRLVVSHLMKNYFPTIYRNVEEVNQIIFPSFQWFICLYVTYLPFPAVLRIWDIFLSEGHITLYRIIIALLYLYEDPLSKAQDVMELNQVFDDIKMNIDVDLLIHTAYPDRECMATKLSPTALFERSYHNIFSTKKKNHHHHSSTTVIEPKKVLKVPDSLIGVGVAHTGPTLEKFISTRYQPNMDISTHEWVETKRIDEIDEKDEITKSAHRMSASFFNETSTLMRMLTSRGIKTKTKKLKKHRLSFQQLPIVFLLSDEEIMNIRAIFRAVFDLHNQKYQAVLNDIRSAVMKKNEER